ncbi:MAG: isopenicillin N synthase family dioxygenase [Flavobacteriaceae bacterium]
MVQGIPKVDLQNYLSHDSMKQKAFIQELGTAFSDIGFVALRGHFLSPELIASLYTEIKAFFDLPKAIKMKYHLPGKGGQRGYTPFGQETAKGFNQADLKEFWHFGQYLEGPDTSLFSYPDNVYVKELPAFNSVGKQVYQALEKTAAAVLKAIACYLEIDPDYFVPFVTHGNSILRPIHYPPITQPPKQAVRAAAHGDINLITLLMGAQGGGLEVQNRAGDWIPALAEEEELMINMGDMMARLTNNKLKSTIHRVVNPPKEQWGHSRYSIPFFMHPVASMPLNCLDNCVDASHPKAFEDITAGAFLHERLIDLGLIKE